MASSSDSFALLDIPYHQLLRNAAERFLEKTAVIFQQQRMTYAQLEAQSNQLAHALADIGLRKGDRIILAPQTHPTHR